MLGQQRDKQRREFLEIKFSLSTKNSENYRTIVFRLARSSDLKEKSKKNFRKLRGYSDCLE